MKFGIREICNVVLKAKKDGPILGQQYLAGQPVLWFDSLKTSGLEGTAETVYARGGRGNTKLIAWDGDKDVTFNMEDALISPMSLALLVGANEVKTEIAYKHIMEVVSIVGGQPQYTYNKTEDKPFFICKADDVSEKIETITDQTKVFVDYYTAVNNNVPAEEDREEGVYYAKAMNQIEISPDSFGANFYLEAETLFRDEDGKDYPAEFIIPNCRVQSQFNFNMSPTGDPSTFAFTMDVFPDTIIGGTKKVLCAIQVSEDEYK